jgi:hypothetical protein
MQRISQEQLGSALDRVLRRTDDYLFDASNAGGGELNALRDLRRARAQLQQRFDQALATGFRRLQEAPMPGKAMDASTLSLVSDEALEEQLATEQVVDNLSKAFAPGLEVLDKRLAALTERPVLLARDNPSGPKYIAESMSNAMAALEVSTNVRIVVYKFLERELAGVLGPLYERLNGGLAAAGVLPMIKPTKRAEPLPQQPPMAGGGPAAAEATDTAAAAAMAGAVSAQGGMTGPGDQALFSSLLNLLQTWRQAVNPQRMNEAGSGSSMSTTDVMTVLSLLQREPPPSFDKLMGDSRQPLAEQMRGQLIEGARRLGMGERASLSNVDEDAVDLVGMLFDVLLDERHFEPDVRTKLNRLLVPYIKVAVKDRRLFLYKAHPARRLLNVVAEASEGNRGESVQDRELMARVDTTIERLVVEFNEDLAIF